MRGNTLTRPVIIGMTLVLATAPAAAGQGQQLFDWSGRVDKEIQLTMSGRNLTVANVGKKERGQKQATVVSRLPREAGVVSLQQVNGRGSADVIQQPTAANGYTTIIRIQDPQSGAADYHLTAY